MKIDKLENIKYSFKNILLDLRVDVVLEAKFPLEILNYYQMEEPYIYVAFEDGKCIHIYAYEAGEEDRDINIEINDNLKNNLIDIASKYL